jgi:hypothetical protein
VIYYYYYSPRRRRRRRRTKTTNRENAKLDKGKKSASEKIKDAEASM